MAEVSLQRVSKQFGTQVVLDEVSFELHAGETVGLVGPNGAGKTTVFRIITGELPPDAGTVTRARGLQVGYLTQEPDVSDQRTLHDEVGAAFAEVLRLETELHSYSERIAAKASDPDLPRLLVEYERVNARFIAAGGHTFEARMHEILGGLGFHLAEYGKPMSLLSGGQRCRAALARLLLEDSELLLLDEPTNHLDIDAVRWLERFLAGHRGGAVVISHDRYLLDRLCTRILELANRRVTSYSGNYSTYAQTKSVQELTRERQFEKDAAFIGKEKEFIARHLAGQRSAEAKGRRTRLERRLEAGEFVTEGVRQRQTVKLGFGEKDARSGHILRADSLTMRFGDKTLFQDLSFLVSASDRLGITGPNGTGKTTLLRILLGEVLPVAGEVRQEQRVNIGYHAQERVVMAQGGQVIDEVRAVRPDLDEGQARSCLARFMFRGDEVFKPLDLLSGGEQSRLRLATLILRDPDVLVLDEPTNHLDIPSREALEEALQEFEGTIIAVSHDRYFLDRVATRLLVMRPEGCRVYAGNYSFYIEELEQQRTARASGPAAGKSARKKARKSPSDGSGKTAPSVYDRMGVEEIEALVIENEVKLAALMERFGDPNIYKDAEALAELREAVEEAERALAEVDAAWQARVEDA